MSEYDTIIEIEILGAIVKANITFVYSPGVPPSGMAAAPEHYDPGSGPELDITDIKLSDAEGNPLDAPKWLLDLISIDDFVLCELEQAAEDANEAMLDAIADQRMDEKREREMFGNE